MKQLCTALSLLAALTVVACAATTFAQEQDTMPAKAMYGHVAPHFRTDIKAPATPLTTWNGSFTYQNVIYKYNMVGTAPGTGTSTTVPVFVIPVKMVYTKGTKTLAFDPLTKKLSNGQTVLNNVLASPIFNAGIDFVQGGTDLGNTQYIDAFQRGNFWGKVATHTGYHLLLGTPTVLPELTLNVPTSAGTVGTEFGIRVGLADINYFDAQLNTYISGHVQIVPNSLPIFVTYETYLTSGGCCIGGYHSATGSAAAPQAYSHFTYIDHPGIFSQDVSALSHEVGEWADDPLVVNTNGNPVQCGILEVGDPEEGFTNYGGFPYTLNGFTYNLQDLTFLPYFGAPTGTSVNHSLTFQGNPFGLTVCSNGG